MLKLYLSNGDVEYLEGYDAAKIGPRLTNLGIRVFRPRADLLFPMNWEGVIKIEEIDDEVEEDETEIEEEEIIEEEPEEEPEEKEEPKKKSAQERNEEALEEMKKLSDCQHPEWDIFYTEGLVGKAKKPVRRYFPVCRVCGLREKFVKTDKLPDEVKEAAKLWDK